MVIKINDLSALKDSLSNNPFLAKFKNTQGYKKFLKKMAVLEYVPKKSLSLLAFSNDNEVLYITDLSSSSSNDSLTVSAIEELALSTGSITKYAIDDNDFFATITDSKLFVGSTEQVISAAMAQGASGQQNPFLKKLYSTSGKKTPATAFISMKTSDSLVSQIFKEDSDVTIEAFSDWISFDLNPSKRDLLFNGVGISEATSKNHLNLFKNTRPLPNVSGSFAPASADAILSYSFDNFAVFSNNQQQYLKSEFPTDSLFNAVEEIGLIYMGKEKAIVLNTYGSETIADFLVSIRKKVADFQGNVLLELKQTDFLNNTFAPIIENFEARYCTILDNAFVFSRTPELLKTIIGDFKRGATFDKTSTYEIAAKASASAATILFVSTSSYLEKLAGNHFIKDIYQDSKTMPFSGYSLAAQVVADGNFFHTNIALKKAAISKKGNGTESLFEFALDSKIASTPQFVSNHTSKKKEIVVQDDQNQLYLISEEGKIVWKKQLDGKVQGRIHQVDLFKNGRLQLVFTTSARLLTLDRNGEEVKILTKYFEGGNLNPLAVFDYEKKKDYRFVVTQGTKVFMYDRQGDIVSGFKYTTAESPILDAPKHMVIGKKDHLVFKLEDGSLKILHRTGAVRVKVAKKFNFSENEIQLYKNQFTITDTKGILHQIDQNGKITTSNLNLNEEHGLESTNNTLVYQNDNILSIRGKKVELDLGVYTSPKIKLLNNKIYVTVTDLQNQKIYLFDSKATPIPNFPLFGNGAIDLGDIDRDGKLELICSKDDNSLILYRLN